MKVSIIGTGYVGLTTGVSLAFLGHQVTCIDIDKTKVQKLREGILPIYEPGLDDLLLQANENIDFTVSYNSILESEIVFFAVGTPATEDGSPNLSYLNEAVNQVLYSLRGKETPTVLVNKSTVPVGTADELDEKVEAAGLDSLVTIASNPEFLRQGRAVHDTLYPDRILVGGHGTAVEYLKQLYLPLIEQSFEAPEVAPRPLGLANINFISLDRKSAELAKYAANAFLAMKISFINEIANVCDYVGADVNRVAAAIGADPRIGSAFLQAGLGYGGSCFPKDTRALKHIADTNGYEFKLLSAVIDVNNSQKYRMVEKVRAELGSLAGKKIAVLGLTFKPGTDDLREAVSIPIINALVSEGAEVYVHDPVAIDKARPILSLNVNLRSDVQEVLQDAEAALLVTEWPEYLALDPAWLQTTMHRPLFIDGRNAMPEASRAGIEYRGIGVGSSFVDDQKRKDNQTVQV